MRSYLTQLKRRQIHCLDVAWQAAAPRRSMSVSEWADTHRELSSKQAGEQGRYRTSRTPFLREIMDCFSATSRVKDIVVMKSSQVGVSEATVNVIGYVMDYAPTAMMVMLPTLDNRDSWQVQKLKPLLQDTSVIKQLLGGNRSRDAANRQDLIDFPGGVLFLAGGNSPNSYAQKSVRIIILDDYDRFPAEIGDEGDVGTLADGRTKAFARPKRCKISTPTRKDTSLIYGAYTESDQRQYHVPCPHCGEYQPLEWGGADKGYGVKWNDSLTQAWYLCRECAVEIYDHHKPEMLANGRWVAQNPSSKVRGYHISAIYAPIGLGPTWLELADKFVKAAKNPAKLQAFINTDLGEPWEEKGDTVDPTGLLARLEEYPESLRVLARTVGVDVQKDRIEVTHDGWGMGEENWTLDHIILPGDTAQEDVWDDLGELLADWGPDAAGIDCGYNTSMVYEFVKKRRWAYALKGMEGPGRPIVEDEKIRKQKLRRKNKKGVIVNIVGDDQAKTLIYSRLKLHEPGPGYIHFPRDPAFDDEYFAQLTAEKQVPRMRGTRPVLVWVNSRPRNETLDCKKYSLAALRLSGIKLGERAEIAIAKAAAVPAATPAAPQSQQQKRRAAAVNANPEWSKRL